MFLYGSGFPKSHNHFGLEGFGTALKPAHEPIIVGQKPYEISHLIAIISYELTNEIHRNVCQRSNVNASDAEKNLRDSRALLNKALPFTVQENVIMYAWERLADANYVAKNTTEPEPDSVLANLSFVPELVNMNGCEENPLVNLILRGGADAIFANIQDIYMSVITNDISENIDLLWRNTLEDVLREASKFTTKMVIRLITELKILKSCLSPSISNDTGNFSPDYQPIIMAMKPCDGTFKQNAEKWGQAGINIDGCRIPTNGEKVVCERSRQNLHEGWDRPYTKDTEYCISRAKESNEKTNTLGRWPANVIFDEEAAEILGEPSRFFFRVEADKESSLLCRAKTIMESWNPDFANIADENTILPEALVNTVLDLAVKKADHEGKRLKSIQTPFTTVTVKTLKSLCESVIILTLNTEKKYWHGSYHLNMVRSPDNHVVSVEIQRPTDITPITINRMNSFGFVVNVTCENILDFTEVGEKDLKSRFIYCAKTSSRERNEGLEGMPEVEKPLMGEFKNNPGRETPKSSPTARQNHHPTVKPLKLMRYLITLIMPPKGGILLDPFAGSGSTIIAAHQLGVKAIGIEKQAEYVEIAKKRLEYYKSFKEESEPDLFDRAINQ
jgi:hypothetical protein